MDNWGKNTHRKVRAQVMDFWNKGGGVILKKNPPPLVLSSFNKMLINPLPILRFRAAA